MKAIVYTGPNDVSFREVSKPDLKENYSLIKISHVGICGTDLNIFAGTHPRAKSPLIMGHEFSGTIASEHPTIGVGEKVTVNPLLSCGKCHPCNTGNPHVCEDLKLVGIDSDGGMAEYVAVPNHCIVPLPKEVSLKTGALVEPISVAVHAIRQGGYKAGDRAVVFGAGTIGLCVALTLRHYGASQVTVIETNDDRLKMAKELGFHTLNPIKDDIQREVRALTSNLGADIVFDCAGHPRVLDLVTDIVKVKGKIVIVAAYKKPAEFQLLQGMFKELTVRFVRVYTPTDVDLAMQILVNNLDFEQLITHVFPPEKAKEGFDLLVTPSEAIKVLYQFDHVGDENNESII